MANQQNFITGQLNEILPLVGVKSSSTGLPIVNAFIHIKYAETEPTQDTDIQDTPNIWIGIYAGTGPIAPTNFEAYTWQRIKGLTGERGYSAYEVWINEGNAGDESDYFAYLKQEALEAAQNANDTERLVAANELLRENAETGRKNAETSRVNAEGIRRSDYVIAEGERDSLYSTAENNRDGLYNTAENARDSTFGIAEGSRVNAFNSAESGRASAEISRNSAEGLRKTAETNRIALHNKWANPEAIATTLEPNESATVNAVIGETKVTFNFGIPEGIQGFSAYEIWKFMPENAEKTEEEYIAFLKKEALEAADSANEEAGLANTAALNANSKAELADTATINANTKAGLANDAATLANTKAGEANAAANLANGKAALADEKAGLANTAANNANNSVVKSAEFVDEDIVFTKEDDTKIILAGAKTTLSAYQTWLDLGNTGTAEDFIAFLKQEAVAAAGLANTAATNANTKAGLANTAALNANEQEVLREEAEGFRASAEISRNSAEGLRQTAETNRITLHNKWSNPEAIATTLAPESPATAEVVIGAEKVTLNIGVPEGIRGNGIVSTVRTAGTGLAGSTDTYTITYDDDTTSTFTVYNGTNGATYSAPYIKQYIIRWDKINSQCVRMGDAATITTDITNFAHRGVVNPSYSNPFDNLYPWRDRKLCKVDRAVYQTLTPESSILDCVTMWEGEPGFALDGTGDFDGVYTPEFWGRIWEDETYVYAGVADGELPGWQFFERTIGGRYFGSKDANGKMTSIANSIAWRGSAVSNMHANAETQNMTLDDIYTWSADTLLMAVEYATLNSQTAVGNGCDSLYLQTHKVGEFALAGSTALKLPNALVSACVAGAVLDLGTTDDATNRGWTRFISSANLDASDPLYATHKSVTVALIPQNVTVDTYCSLHGCYNAPDLGIGSKSGYIGTNTKCNAYYRGRIAHANYWRYVLGAYRQQDTDKIWVANDRQESWEVDALNTSKHKNTNLVIAPNSGYISKLGLSSELPLAPFVTETGGSAGSANPVGDYLYRPASSTVNTVLLAGGNSSYGVECGRFCGYWRNAAFYSHWGRGAFPFLKTPEGERGTLPPQN